MASISREARHEALLFFRQVAAETAEEFRNLSYREQCDRWGEFAFKEKGTIYALRQLREASEDGEDESF